MVELLGGGGGGEVEGVKVELLSLASQYSLFQTLEGPKSLSRPCGKLFPPSFQGHISSSCFKFMTQQEPRLKFSPVPREAYALKHGILVTKFVTALM